MEQWESDNLAATARNVFRLQEDNRKIIRERDAAREILEKLHSRVFNDNGDMTVNLDAIATDIFAAYFLVKKYRK